MADHLHTPTHAATNPLALAEAAHWADDDYDIALGCECADPALQIERWSHEMLGPSAEPH